MDDDGQRRRDAALMRRALHLAAAGPRADPNPRVGAVVLDRGGAVVGEGHHEGAGTPHAEVMALRAAGAAAAGGTAVVTLEPCAHTGRTGPCAAALRAAGIARVVYAQPDPDQAAAGGAALLREHGIAVTAGVLEHEAAALNLAWAFAVGHGRPMVTWKLAATLDGRSAAADGTSRWITSAAARADVHDQRAACGAVLVGTGTALTDDPHLTLRHPDGSLRPRQPLRVVLGRRPLPPAARVLDDAAPSLQLPHRDLHLALKALADMEIRHVWLEGGPTLAAAFLTEGLVDEVVAYLAPVLLGAGSAAVGDLGIPNISGALRLRLRDVTTIGPDIRVRATTDTTTTTTDTATTTEGR